jgi:EAL domain-containing protein (putative c-di-GMP-specific phosphodiesterase class I)/GGDEF domain-containing protein
MGWGHRSRKSSAASNAGSASRDEVTGLVTYAPFLHLCADALGSRGSGRAELLLMDIEGIAESVAGEHDPSTDQLIRQVATRVEREVGSVGVLARTSDHQLGVLFADAAQPTAALDLAYRVSALVSAPVTLDSGRRVQLSVSCGLASHSVLGPRPTASELFRAAGLAVREAHRLGRNRIEVCTRELIAIADETIAIGKDLRQALQDKGLRVCYQPMVDLTHGSVLGFEALVRWSHPVHGHVSPARFVPVAEEFGLVSEMGRMVMSTASAQVQRWSETFGLQLNAHVNVSAVDLATESFVDTVEACLLASNLPAEQLVVEVTESAVEPDLEVAASRFEALHDLGVRIAIDDFGTGRSALSTLQMLSVDILKVDRSYLHDVDGQPTGDPGPEGDDMLRGVVALGHAMGFEVYGEGIEDEQHRLRLQSAGCDIGQGYLFARPLPSDEAAAMLREQCAPVTPLKNRLLAVDGWTL